MHFYGGWREKNKSFGGKNENGEGSGYAVRCGMENRI